MGLISRFGAWLDRKFPDRVPVEEVYRSLQGYAQIDVNLAILQKRVDQIAQKLEAFERGAQSFDKTQSEFKDELNKIRAVLAVFNRSKVAPVMPSGEPWKR